MSSSFMLYGATGFVGDAVARMAVQDGLRPILAGRNTNSPFSAWIRCEISPSAA